MGVGREGVGGEGTGEWRGEVGLQHTEHAPTNLAKRYDLRPLRPLVAERKPLVDRTGPYRTCTPTRTPA